jgi:hypothetical protein
MPLAWIHALSSSFVSTWQRNQKWSVPISDGQPAQCSCERLTFSPVFGVANLVPVPADEAAVEPFVVASPAPTTKLTPLPVLDAPPAVLPPMPPPPIPPPKLGIPCSLRLAPARDRTELPAIVEIGGDEGGAGGDDRGA